MKAQRIRPGSFLLFVSLFLLLFGMPSLYAENPGAGERSLQRAISLLEESRWEEAAFEAHLGSTYDPVMADFPYIEGLALAARKAPLADTIARVEASLSAGLFWRNYTRKDAVLFCAGLYADTLRYRDALSLLDSLDTAYSADADYVRVLSLYGSGRYAQARTLLSSALERWPFDTRFPRAFLLRETALRPDDASIKLASTILSRLYLWENDDRELLLLAVPFEANRETRERNIRIYRSMGKSDSANAGISARVNALNTNSSILALEYGVISETEAVQEIFACTETGIPLEHLKKLLALCGSTDIRKEIISKLEHYEGILTADANRDGIIDARIAYRLGRPSLAVFDRNQDGYPDYTVSCDAGKPVGIKVAGSDPSVPLISVDYDSFPSVKEVTEGKRIYTIKPLALSWAPVEWVRQDFGPGIAPFYTIGLTGREVPLTERLLINSSVFYHDADAEREGGETRVTLEQGVPIASESTFNARPYSSTTYNRGFPSITRTDRDDDGYFETTVMYGKTGLVESISIDRNGNRRLEYRELYLAGGTIEYQWDSDENGTYEILYTVSANGTATTEWIHPETGLPVVIVTENGKPRSVRYNKIIRQIVADPAGMVYWVGAMPDNAREIGMNLVDMFNRSSDPVVILSSVYAGRKILAIRTGGLIFAEIINE